jgi:hypothetical protein
MYAKAHAILPGHDDWSLLCLGSLPHNSEKMAYCSDWKNLNSNENEAPLPSGQVRMIVVREGF